MKSFVYAIAAAAALAGASVSAQAAERRVEGYAAATQQERAPVTGHARAHMPVSLNRGAEAPGGVGMTPDAAQGFDQRWTGNDSNG